ncbi:PspC domain-containing protein [Candidatus Woesebacteria bacterium]|nr:PspC domain-containing protein [Candidatus Woesebacteria bacterium]
MSRSKKIHKLYRSKVNRIVAGVCGGIAEYFDTDPWLVRILMIIVNPTILIYLILWMVIPENPDQ